MTSQVKATIIDLTLSVPRLFYLAIVLCSSVALLAQPAGAAFRWDLPDWIPPPAEPAANPITPAKVELRRHLFYDRRLSADLTMACATCHVHHACSPTASERQ